MRNKTIGYDETKKLLNKIRFFNEKLVKGSNFIKEDVNPEDETQTSNEPIMSNQFDDVTVINDVEVKIISPDKEDLEVTKEESDAIRQLIDNFRQQVSQIVEFEPGMTISDNQIRLDGNLTTENIGFVFISGGDENGTYLNMDMTRLNNEVKVAIEKLLKFEETYQTAMAPLIKNRTNT